MHLRDPIRAPEPGIRSAKKTTKEGSDVEMKEGSDVEMRKDILIPPQQELRLCHLLCWLLVYPASSAQDLSVALGLHPSTVYRVLAQMQQAGLVQAIIGYGGRARFAVTRKARSRLSRVIEGNGFPISTAGWLSRLSTLDRLHSFACLFFHYAPRALARAGHAARVRWHLVRDWRFLLTPHAPVQAHAVLAWTVEETRRPASHTWAADSGCPERGGEAWEAAIVLLETGFCSEPLIITRLRALLRYRTFHESKTWPAPMPFPPLLVLVEDERQREIWQRANHRAASVEGTTPLVGAIARSNHGPNPWQWSWRDLSSGAQVSLSVAFAPVPSVALPDGVLAHITAMQQMMQGCDQILHAMRLLVAGQTRDLRHTPHVAPLAPWRQALLTLLARAPLMTAAEIAAVTRRTTGERPLRVASVERRLRDLARSQLAERSLVVEGGADAKSAMWRWHLTDAGLRHVASQHQVSLVSLKRQASRDRFVLQRQGAHLAGVYRMIAAFHQASASDGAIRVAWWEVGRFCQRTYHYHGLQRTLRPDAELELVLRCEEGSVRRVRLWLEYDLGSMHRRDLDRKMQSYATYWEAREWAAEGLSTLPRLLFVVPEIAEQGRRVRQACETFFSGTHLRVLVTTPTYIEYASPFGQIWRQVFPPPLPRNEARHLLLWE